MNKPIYLDYNATTPCSDEVINSMLPYFKDFPGNPASKSHKAGRLANMAVNTAKENLGKLIQVNPEELIITSGATEAINLAIKGVYEAYHSKGNHIITVKTEHKAVLDVCYYLEAKCGAELTYLDVDKNGHIDLDQLESSITSKTILVAVMWANNETGVLQPMDKIAQICNEKQVILFSDATQAVGKIPCQPKLFGVHMLCLSAHKFYGPKGVGALYMSSANPKIKIIPQIHGGGHQNNLRSGTLNVPAIVGMGAAADIAEQSISQTSQMAKMRDELQKILLSKIPNSFVNGDTSDRLPNTLNMCFEWINGEELIVNLEEKMAISTGSACSSASLSPSHVLMAMGLKERQAKASLRFSLGADTQLSQIHEAADYLIHEVNSLRSQNPIWQMIQDGVDVDSLD